ncbi:GGDEF domain-containing protein [Paenibacillus sp. LjRoot153]|uniref:GGDEF domain-containing protein n=1 Tax=Paenibacillus sp. LjRoot153 TaxID=3342270 RepID=UPI003ED00B99
MFGGEYNVDNHELAISYRELKKSLNEGKYSAAKKFLEKILSIYITQPLRLPPITLRYMEALIALKTGDVSFAKHLSKELIEKRDCIKYLSLYCLTHALLNDVSGLYEIRDRIRRELSDKRTEPVRKIDLVIAECLIDLEDNDTSFISFLEEFYTENCEVIKTTNISEYTRLLVNIHYLLSRVPTIPFAYSGRYLSEAEGIAERNGLKYRLVNIYNSLGTGYHKSNLFRSYNYYYKSWKIAEELDVPCEVTIMNMAMVCLEIGDYLSANYYISKVEQFDPSNFSSELLLEMVKFYLHISNYDMAYAWIKKLTRITRVNKTNQLRVRVFSHYVLVLVFMGEKQRASRLWGKLQHHHGAGLDLDEYFLATLYTLSAKVDSPKQLNELQNLHKERSNQDEKKIGILSLMYTIGLKVTLDQNNVEKATLYYNKLLDSIREDGLYFYQPYADYYASQLELIQGMEDDAELSLESARRALLISKRNALITIKSPDESKHLENALHYRRIVQVQAYFQASRSALELMMRLSVVLQSICRWKHISVNLDSQSQKFQSGEPSIRSNSFIGEIEFTTLNEKGYLKFEYETESDLLRLPRDKLQLIIQAFEFSLHELNISELYTKDVLTNMYNRNYVLDKIRNDFNACQAICKDLTCLMIDIDNFRNINNSYGHLVGDKAIIEVSNVILNKLGHNGIASRYGGEEFLVALPNVGQEFAVNIANEILTGIRGIKLGFNITASIGLSSFKDDSPSDVIELIDQADKAEIWAKSNGKNQVACFSSIKKNNI